MKVAVNGCCHGELDALYGMIERMQKEQDIKIDLLICCGDFESLRNTDDLRFFCAPPKYRVLKDFHKYYQGEKKAPVLTIVVGGNHEAPNVLRELYYGGWLAPNIFYLGYSGVVRIGGLRIAGLSGIYNSHHFNLGHFERPPYNDSTARSSYHVRQFELLKLHCIEEPVDIMLSHDWPEGIYNFGDKKALLRCKPHFREDIQRNSLGSPASMALLKKMKPSFWFCGHMHVAFPALVGHPDGSATRFLAVDKVLPNRRCLQVVDIHPKTPAKYLKKPAPETNISADLRIEYDIEWLAILRANQTNIPTSQFRCNSQATFPSAEDRLAVVKNLRRLTGSAISAQEDAVGKSELLPHTGSQEGGIDNDSKTKRGDVQVEDCGENNEAKTDESFPWPLWTDPPFQQLEEQRRRLLQLIGMEHADVLGDNQPCKVDAYPAAPTPPPKNAELGTKALLVKPPQEEISLDLDEI